jgi:hypothetical protein
MGDEFEDAGVECGESAAGGARSDGTPKIVNPLITHNTIQFKKSKGTENIVALNSTSHLLLCVLTLWLARESEL